jgi:GNAT superfamily N-acetyltransferase
VLSFRLATPADVPAIVALVESAYRGEPSRAGWTTEADLLHGQRTDADAIHTILSTPDNLILLAFPDSTPGSPAAGLAVGGPAAESPLACCHLERHPGYAYFGLFAVRPTAQATGVGKTVLAEAERLATTTWAVPEMRMTVITARPELTTWYERRGYARTGKLAPFPYGDERFGIPQVTGLEFELLTKALPEADAANPATATSGPPAR